MFRKLKSKHIKATQAILDEYLFLWNFYRNVPSKGKTPGELAKISIPSEMLGHFSIQKEQIYHWVFWHIEGIHNLMHAYLREDMLKNDPNQP